MTYFVDAAVLVPVMVLLVRLAGLRAFSKMTSFDFAVTVSFGSVLAATVLSPSTTVVQGILALVALFAVQWAIGTARARFAPVKALSDNAPILLMRDGQILEANMAATGVARSDLVAKLREANVMDFSEVRAVVLETTGDVSVLHGTDLDEGLLDGVSTTP
ncbi:DUF421 domain-containing protein [Jannaschia pohangensis]|nr:YetF domain-containing protein [Jannaschia pohangensis]